MAIVDFWECATAYLGKSAPKREDIEAEIMEIIERENDTLNLLQGALDVMNNSGFQAEITSILDTDEPSAIVSQRRRERGRESWYRDDEEQLQRNHDRSTLLDYSEIRQMTSRYIGYMSNDELMSMLPAEWNDWIIGARQALIDQRDIALYGAQYNAVAQAGKSLKRFVRQNEREHYIIRGQEDEYEKMKQRELAKTNVKRNTKQGTRKFLNSLKQVIKEVRHGKEFSSSYYSYNQ